MQLAKLREGVEWEGTAAGKYASQLLKAGCAAQPGGCSARFVPACVRVLVVSDDREVGCRVSCCLLAFGSWDDIDEDGMGLRSGG